jgi:hypothetical protein
VLYFGCVSIIATVHENTSVVGFVVKNRTEGRLKGILKAIRNSSDNEAMV